jgi:hypothetical protein
VARRYGSAALAILLWPLLFLGIDLPVREVATDLHKTQVFA